MFKEFINILKWFTNLEETKRVVFLMGAAILVISTLFLKRDRENSKQHNEIKSNFSKRLDTCERNSNRMQVEISYWKDSLASEKLKNALEELTKAQNLVKEAKKIEKNINNTNNKIKNSLNK